MSATYEIMINQLGEQLKSIAQQIADIRETAEYLVNGNDLDTNDLYAYYNEIFENTQGLFEFFHGVGNQLQAMDFDEESLILSFDRLASQKFRD